MIYELKRKPANVNEIIIYAFLLGVNSADSLDSTESPNEYDFIGDLTETYNQSNNYKCVKDIKSIIKKYKEQGGLEIDFLGTQIKNIEKVMHFKKS